MKVSGYDLRHVAILQLLHFMLFVHLDVPLILCDHMKTCSYLIDDCLGNCFEVLNTSTSVMGWQMEEKTWAQKFQSSWDELWHSCLCQPENTCICCPCVAPHTTPPDLLSITSVYFGLWQVCIFFLKALISYRRGKLVAFLFYFAL